MGLENIRAFLSLADGIGTSGMPSAEQFSDISAAGFKTVINLALPTSDNALPNEGELVTCSGMTYVHIPVLFDAPKRADYDRFERIMNSLKPEPVFVHCAANMRVSAFMFLYRLRNSQIPREVAEADLHKIWRPNRTWAEFIDSALLA